MPNELPDLLRAYVERNVPSPPGDPIGTLLHQTGHIRLSPDGAWLPFTAEQTIEAATTGFVWHARCKMMPLVTAIVEDAFEDGHGRLDAKIWGAIPVAHGRGPDIDRGEAERYLAELAWCPTALVHNPDLHFETLDHDHIRVWAFDEKTYVDLLFDADGDIRGARTTTRKRDDHAQPWAGRFSEYRRFESGIRAPSQGEVWWEDEEGDFLYWRGEITDLEWKPS